jgi:hypothetical protein
MYVEVPVVTTGLVGTWLVAFGLLVWWTTGGPVATAVWGLFTSAIAAAWTVVFMLQRQMAMLRFAFQLGQGDRAPVSLSDRR